ncbi:transposase domain-containing protein [Pseudomonas chlororaphis]|uniref:transposase domain-containing protein n=1 Tax=Pseudomonas chlororaphis TaxID=587753 RepID=UPI003B75C168
MSVETAKANGQEPYAWLSHVLECLTQPCRWRELRSLLTWNCSPEMPREKTKPII